MPVLTVQSRMPRVMMPQASTLMWVWSSPNTAVRSTPARSEEHTSELQSRLHLVCRLLLEKKTAQLSRPHSCGRTYQPSGLHVELKPPISKSTRARLPPPVQEQALTQGATAPLLHLVMLDL